MKLLNNEDMVLTTHRTSFIEHRYLLKTKKKWIQHMHSLFWEKNRGCGFAKPVVFRLISITLV